MKKFLILALTFALLLTSCASTLPRNELPGTDDGTDLPVIDNLPADIGNEIIEIDLYDWHSSWANWTDDERVMQGIINPDTVSHFYPRTHLPLYRIDSAEELEKFIEDYSDVFSMNYKYDENEGFAVATAHCDIDFFADKFLLAAYMEAPSGSFRYGVRTISIDNGALVIEVEQTNDPGVHTDDMSGWLVTVEMLRTPVTDCTSFDAVFVGIKGREDEPYVPVVMSEPPELTVISPIEEIKASMGTSSWFYQNGDGSNGAKIYDSNHPMSEYFFEAMPRLSNDKFVDVEWAKLAFDFWEAPELTIRRWNAELVGQDNVDSLAETVKVDDGILFEINQKDCYVYEVTAVWDDSDGLGGNVTYVFSIGPTE